VTLFAIIVGALLGAADAGVERYPGLGEGKPVMPRELSSLKPGTPAGEVERFFGDFEHLCLDFGVVLGPWCVIPLPDDRGRYSRSGLVFESVEETRAILRNQWGPPTVVDKHAYWLNPDAKPKLRTHLRAMGDRALLELDEYVPLAALLGSGPDFAFEKRRFLGASVEALRQAYASHDQVVRDETIEVYFPPSEVGDRTLVRCELREGKVVTWSLDITVGDALAREELVVKLLEAKWGARKRVAGDVKAWRFAARSDVLVEYFYDDLRVTVGR